jgi:hypothetical protein
MTNNLSEGWPTRDAGPLICRFSPDTQDRGFGPGFLLDPNNQIVSSAASGCLTRARVSYLPDRANSLEFCMSF